MRQAQEANQLPAIFSDVRRGKALAGVVGMATITDTEGTTIDLDELLGRGDDTEEDTADGDDAELVEGEVVEGEVVEGDVVEGDVVDEPLAAPSDEEVLDEKS